MEKLLTLKGKQAQGGFSLVELMIVVAIIGILAALAVPRFQMFQAKAKQSEAKNNLSHIYTLEESYYGDNEKYGVVSKTDGAAACPGDNIIGFRVTPCAGGKVRYAYEGVATDTTFLVSATADSKKIVAGGCAGLASDEWSINEKKELTDVAKLMEKCK